MAPDESVPEDAEARREEFERRLQEILSPLSERELEIIIMRFGMIDGHSRTVQETAEHFGLTREEVYQIEASALHKLRHPGDDGPSEALVRR